MGRSYKERAKDFDAVVEAITSSVSDLPTPAIRRVIPILSQAQAEAEKDLRRWLASEDGEARFTTQRLRASLVSIRRSLETIKRLHPELAAGLKIGSRTAGQLATNNLEAELIRFGEIFEGTIQPMNLDASDIISDKEKVLFKQFDSSAKRYAGKVGTRLMTELAVGRARGETIDELSARLEKSLPNLFEGFKNSARRVARTETMSAYNTYHQAGIERVAQIDPDIVERWDAKDDWRLCRQCAALDAKERKPGSTEKFKAEWTTVSKGKVKHHRSAHDKAPAHPNCRCVIVAWRSDWKMPSRPNRAAAQLERKQGTEKKAKPLGEYKHYGTQWLPGESAAERKKRIQREQGERYRLKKRGLAAPPIIQLGGKGKGKAGGTTGGEGKGKGAAGGEVKLYGTQWLPGETAAERKKRMQREQGIRYRYKKSGRTIPPITHLGGQGEGKGKGKPEPQPKWDPRAPKHGETVYVKNGDGKPLKVIRVSAPPPRFFVQGGKSGRTYSGSSATDVSSFWSTYTREQPHQFVANAPRHHATVYDQKTGHAYMVIRDFPQCRIRLMDSDTGVNQVQSWRGWVQGDVDAFWKRYSLAKPKSKRAWAKTAPKNGITVYLVEDGDDEPFKVSLDKDKMRVRVVDADLKIVNSFDGTSLEAMSRFWRQYTKKKPKKKVEAGGETKLYGTQWLPGETPEQRKKRMQREQGLKYRLRKAGKPIPPITPVEGATPPVEAKAGKAKKQLNINSVKKRMKNMHKLHQTDQAHLEDDTVLAEKRVREGIKPVVAEMGCVERKAAWTSDSWRPVMDDRLEVRRQSGAAGSMDLYTGKMTVGPDQVKGAANFLEAVDAGRKEVQFKDADNFQTFIHEQFHLSGPRMAASKGSNYGYAGKGKPIEEATTELVSRRWMRGRFAGIRARSSGLSTDMKDVFTPKGHRGYWQSYQGYIDAMAASIKEEFGVSTDKAYQLLDDAALRFKQTKGNATKEKRVTELWLKAVDPEGKLDAKAKKRMETALRKAKP